MTRRVAVGVGMSSRARAEEVSRLIGEALHEADLQPGDVDVVATIDTRAGHRAMKGVRWPVVTFTREELAAGDPQADEPQADEPQIDEPPRVAEPAALLAAGAGATLVVDKRRSKHATVAIAVAVEQPAPYPETSRGAFDRAMASIEPLDDDARHAAIEHHLRLTKPPGSLGRLETLGATLAAISGEVPPPVPRPGAIAVFAGDHGVHASGVTPWPQAVTAQMVTNLASGGAAVNVLAHQLGIAVTVVDVGVATDLPVLDGVLHRRVANGTADLATGPAMTREQAVQALDVGASVATDLVSRGARCLLTGEMGIANTTPSAALIAVFTGRPAAEVTGRGTGIDDAMLSHKTAVVAAAVERVDPTDPLATLAELGGFEIAALVGFIVGGVSARVPVIVDGVIAGAALLTAARFVPGVADHVIAGHRSAEPGATAVLEAVGLEPLIDLDLRLGEGTGACLAFPIVEAAARLLREMATFDSAGVSGHDHVADRAAD